MDCNTGIHLDPHSEIYSVYSRIYSEMKSRNQKLLEEKGPQYDPLLNSIDYRRCLAIYSFGQFDMNSTFYHFIDKVFKLFPEQDVYTINAHNDPRFHNNDKPRLHHTFLQLVTFSESQHIDSYLKHIDFFENLISSIPIYEIYFYKLILVPTGLLMVGIPTVDLNQHRDRIRKAMLEHGVPIMEPYKNDIVHSTLFRFPSAPSEEQLKKLKKLVDLYSDTFFGKATIDQLSISRCSWKMAPRELENEIVKVVNLTL
jgi:hypothetical protein